MDPWYLALLALLQGLTEFLPISSSAHLILLPRVLDVADQGLAFDVAANTGTLLAALAYFREDLVRLVLIPLGSPRRARPELRLLGLMLVASVPVLGAGWALRDQVATLARNPALIGVTSILFGVVLGLADRTARQDRGTEEFGVGRALFIGFGQALALIPGTSRSGITMTGGLFMGLRRAEAARFSFLLAIPVSAAAAVSELGHVLRGGLSAQIAWQLALVVAVSAAAGFAVIHLFLAFLRRQSLMIFVVYRVLMGMAILVLAGC